MIKMEEIKEKAKEAKEKVTTEACRLGDAFGKVCEENPTLIFTLAMSVGGGLIGILSGATNINKERDEKCLVEDNITGCEYLTKHPLTNSEILELSDLVVSGQTRGEALDSMGLLRKEKKRR